MGGAKSKRKTRVYAVHLTGPGTVHTFCLEAQNVEHLYNLLRGKFEDELPCGHYHSDVAVLDGSERINAEVEKKLNDMLGTPLASDKEEK